MFCFPLKINAFEKGILKSRKMHLTAHTKAAIGILFADFYTNWPTAWEESARREQHSNAIRPSKGYALQSRIKTAINHSCWASFKYKSISIFHLEPSLRRPEKKRVVSGRYHHTHNIDRLTWENLSFLWNTQQRLYQKCAYKMKVNFFPLWLARDRWCCWW